MEYRRSGRSGIRIPVLALGLWHNFGSHKPFRDVQAMAHFAFDNGICHFDLANNYGPEYGTAEENFGQLMERSFRPYRDELLVSTKAGWDMWPGPYGNWGSRKYLMASLDQSLQRMKLDYVDVFYSHRWDPETPLEETMQALVDIVRQGKALYVGLSRYPAEQARKAYQYLAERDVPCLLYQDRYNIIDRAPERDGLIDLGRENGVGFISFSPLQQGLLTNRYLNGVPADSRMAQGVFLKEEMRTPTLLGALNGLNDLARERNQSLAQMALSWLLNDARVTSVIIGASSVAQLEDNLKALDNTRFTPAEMRRIEQLSGPVQI
jgi:L-glyceraldehyde 3-phosphate reductase